MNHIIPFFFVLTILYSCNNSHTFKQEIQLLKDTFAIKHYPFSYYKDIYGDSLFTEDILAQGDDIYSFYHLPYVKLPYGKRSKELLEQYFKITDYQKMPPYPVLKKLYTDSLSFYQLSEEDYLAAYWLSINNDTAEIVEVDANPISQEAVDKFIYVQALGESPLESLYSWYYPSQQRELYISIRLEILNYTTQEKLTQHLSSYQINWLQYLNFIDSLNTRGWEKDIAQQQLEYIFNKNNISVYWTIENSPEFFPFIFHPVQDSMLALDDYMERYKSTKVKFSYLDTIPASTDSLFLEFFMNVYQFAPHSTNVPTSSF